jgi:hypothetical protein
MLGHASLLLPFIGQLVALSDQSGRTLAPISPHAVQTILGHSSNCGYVMSVLEQPKDAR